MGLLILVLAFITGFLCFTLFLQLILHNRLALTVRMEMFTQFRGPRTILDEKLSAPFSERVIRPIISRIAGYLGRIIPVKQNQGLQKKLLMAGNPGGFSAGEFMAIEYAAAALLILAGLLLVFSGNQSLSGKILILFGAGFAGFYLPNFYLQTRASQRKKDIQKALPDVLDLLTVSVEAGLGFDAALSKVIEKTKGVLADEFNRMLQEIKMGKPRRDALHDLGENSGNEDLQSFVGSLVQADQLGISIGNVLRIQSDQMRTKRRQAVEEKAMKAPIKMLIPMVFFIFPTLFIVLLGPAVIQVINNLK